MSGTVSGGKKAAQSNMKKHGKDFYKRIGQKGGKNSKRGGFASEKIGKDGLTGAERAKLAGAKGGRISKRVPASIKELQERITEDSKLFTVLQDYLPSEKEIKRTIRKSLKDTYDE